MRPPADSAPPHAPTTRSPGAALHSAARAAFWTLTAIALPGALLSTAAWFFAEPALFAQLSPFRVQYAVVLGLHAASCLLLRRRRWALVFAAFAFFNLGALIHATRLPFASAAASPASVSDARPIKIVFANVLTSNPDSAPLLALVAREKPDFVALLEVNNRWRTELIAALSADYPFHRVHPREDNFGLALFAREQPAGGRIEYFADVETPSFDFTCPRPEGSIRILLTHPLPPGDQASTRFRNQHLADLLNWQRFVAGLAGPDETPASVLILGDLNATPWCPPLRRFLAASGLRPAASDQGMLGTSWPVPIPFLRIPLDHALLSPDLVCVSYRIGPDIGSDHFPFILEVRPRPRTR